MILCNIGGIIGVLAGFGMGNLVALVFCSMVGVSFGMLPAVRASNLHPIDALRHE